jgi:AraC-like DNA-binding protein
MVKILQNQKTFLQPESNVHANGNNSIAIQHEYYEPQQIFVSALHNHIIEFNVGEAFRIVKPRSQELLCERGHIVRLLSPGKPDPCVNPRYECMRLILPVDYVDEILGTQGFAFQSISHTADPFLFDLVCKLNEEILKGEQGQRIYIDALSLAIVIHLGSKYPMSGKKLFAPKGKLSSLQLSNVVEFTRSAINRNIRLSELAACVYLSEFHFARLFRQTVGISPYKFVLQMKVELAQNLMRLHNSTFSDIAYRLNFTDQAHFSHVFKRITGSSPRSFRSAVGGLHNGDA